MISEKMQNAINDQINAEFYSGYLYLAMSTFAESINYKGFASWFRKQSEEENTHAFKLLDYLQERGGRAILKALGEPPADFKSIEYSFEQTLSHEKTITARIHKLYELAVGEKDYATQSFLQWFINEQVEEEATAEEILDQIKMVESKPGSLFYIDRHIGKRQ